MVVRCQQVLVLLVQCGLVSGQGATPLPEQHSSISSVLLNLVLISTFIVLIMLVMKKPRIDAGTSAQAQLAQAQAGTEAACRRAATWKEDMQPAMSELAQALRCLGKRRYEVARQRYESHADSGRFGYRNSLYPYTVLPTVRNRCGCGPLRYKRVRWYRTR